MNVRILCPGPSLYYHCNGFFSAGDRSSLDIAVNEAILDFPSPIWAFGESDVFYKYTLSKQPMILCPAHSTIEINNRDPARARKHFFLPHAQIESIVPPLLQWQTFTMTAAIAFALALGAERISCLGCDWKPEEGTPLRSGDRFAREKRIFERLAAWAHGRDQRVERYGIA